MANKSISFFVNGKEVTDCEVEPEWTLLWFLRNSNSDWNAQMTDECITIRSLELGLTGPKLGCGEGGCGACTVLVSQCVDIHSQRLEHRTVNACLTPICSVEGCHVVTVEGLGSVSPSNLHPVQSRMAEFFGSQCGFCTPGIVMSLYGTVAHSENSSSLTMHDIEDALDGNLCRCTGYRSILDAAKSFATDVEKLPRRNPSTLPITSTSSDKCLAFAKDNTSSLPQLEFPQQLRQYVPRSLHIQGRYCSFYVFIDLLLQVPRSNGTVR